MKTEWYKDIVFYQIWPRSFSDGNDDGIGDLHGVYNKLEYLKELGIGGIWFSPLYVSPNADYGYDIADYRDISPDYGDLETFKKVLDKAHSLGIKVIMDLVVNHTSDEHEWFQQSRDKDSKYRDYYIWRKGRSKNRPPNNWDGLFEADAWQFDEKSGEYYLHLFLRKQADLNMDNPVVREEVKDIMRFWLDMGVDGFREDVITFISKKEGLPNGISPVLKGLNQYNNGPHLHEYLNEFRRDVLDKYDSFVIGEAPMMTPKKALKLISEESERPLDAMFHFQNMSADCIFTEYVPRPFNLRKLKRSFSRWQKGLYGKGWNALYLENHDHPRIISRYGNEKYRVQSGKMLAVSFLFQQGTPFIYQGQEIGMTNIALDSIDKYKDCVAINRYNNGIKKKSKEEMLALIQHASRDSARTPVQWSDDANGGFSSVEPWFTVNPNYPEVNVQSQENDPDSLLNFYRAILKYRNGNPIIRHGTYNEYNKCSSDLFIYSREHEGKKLLIICSFTEKSVTFKTPRGFDLDKATLVFFNYDNAEIKDNKFVTKPYEARVYEV